MVGWQQRSRRFLNDRFVKLRFTERIPANNIEILLTVQEEVHSRDGFGSQVFF